MADILAIIPFYKRQDQLDKCLEALRASTVAVEPYVHDNNTNNLGFTKPCNLGMREALRRGHKYCILLNQDCYVRPDAVEKAIAFMDAHPRCAIAGPKQLRAEEPDQIIHGGCADAYPTGRHFTGHVSKGDCAVSLPMPWVNGACMVVRVEALYEIGLMDEGYFLIASDSDFCFTARQRGWETWYCAESVVLHEGGGVSSKQMSLAAIQHFNADQIHFRDKWVGTAGFERLKQVPPHRVLPPAEAAPHLQQTVAQFNRGEVAQAEINARLLLDHSPDLADAKLLLGMIYLRTGFPGLATRYLEAVTKSVPDSAQAWAALADGLAMCGQYAPAIEAYTTARGKGLRSVELLNNLGLCLAHVGRKDEAVAGWREALGMDPGNAAVRKNLTDHGVTDLPPAPPTPPTAPQGAFSMRR